MYLVIKFCQRLQQVFCNTYEVIGAHRRQVENKVTIHTLLYLKCIELVSVCSSHLSFKLH